MSTKKYLGGLIYTGYRELETSELVLISKPGKLNEDASNSILFYHSDAGVGAEKKYRNT